MYSLELTEQDVNDIYFVGFRYGWADALIKMGIDIGKNTYSESDIWTWQNAVDEDTIGGHDIFPMLDTLSDLGRKLCRLYDSIV